MGRQLEQLERLLMDLTDLARGGAGGQSLRRQEVDVAQLLRDVIQDAEGVIRSSHHELRADLEPLRATVQGDPDRLRQVFSNVLLNAAKYTDPGGQITVSARVDATHVMIGVRDNGHGIDAEVLPRIFDVFVRADQTQPGMGVGLSVVRQIVEQHGGHVHARSEGKGCGSEFVVTLPLVRG
jgi:signal transduction histidine kinase